MQTRLVYRIEDAEGRGPFNSPHTQEFYAKLPERWRYESNRFPTASEDGGFTHLWDAQDPGGHLWEHGCCSLGQLRYWFTRRIAKILDGLGYQFTIWRVPDDYVFEGKRQALFSRPHATLIERKPATALWQQGTETRLAA